MPQYVRPRTAPRGAGLVRCSRTRTGPPCPEDLNGDGQVNGGDLALILSSWGGDGDDGADLNGDGTVNGADMALILSAWGDCL